MLGVVLAGGRSSRMGRTKALLEVGGTPMARLVADALRHGGCDRVVLVGGRADELASIGLPVVPDAHPGEGPLGGLLTAFGLLARPASGEGQETAPRETAQVDSSRSVFVAPCDLPALSWSVVRTMVDRAVLAEEADVVVARAERLEPALAIWHESAAVPVREMFDEGERALHRAMRSLRVVEVHVEPAALHNVNAPRDLIGDPGGNSRRDPGHNSGCNRDE